MTANSKEYNHNYYLKHRIEKLGVSANQYKKNREHLLDLRHQRYLKQREVQSEKDHKRYIEIRNEIIQFLGDKCVNPYNLLPHPDWCNNSACLQIDHINGGGGKERGKSGGTEAYYKRILAEVKAGSKDYQLLCANCNFIKREKNKENARRRFV